MMNNIMRHPVLGVPICRNCRYFYDGDGSDESWEKDEDGVDLYCRWCGQVSWAVIGQYDLNTHL